MTIPCNVFLVYLNISAFGVVPSNTLNPSVARYKGNISIVGFVQDKFSNHFFPPQKKRCCVLFGTAKVITYILFVVRLLFTVVLQFYNKFIVGQVLCKPFINIILYCLVPIIVTLSYNSITTGFRLSDLLFCYKGFTYMHI